MADRVVFLRPDAERIARVVRAVENGNRDQQPLRFGRVPTEGGGKTFRICTFTGAWSKESLKTVVLKYQTSTPNTFIARNLFANIATATASARNCAIAKEGTAWYLIAAEC